MKKLSAYNKKRKFLKTPEPKEDEAKHLQIIPDSPLKFVIHEHHARRLHYDLRLELNGVLKSWAVPKGPPQKIGDRRLAVHVEDHPLSYGDFSGMIPEGNYGAGTVHIWDNGAYSSMQTAERSGSEKILRQEYDKGRMHIMMAGKKLKGLYTLVHTKENQWLWMIKKTASNEPKNQHVKSGKDEMPKKIRPMLATLFQEPFDKEGWGFEIKWDGYRAISETGNSVKIYSRNGIDFTETYKPITNALRAIPYMCVLDGEIIALDNKGNPQFQLLQEYENIPARIAYAIFDILYIDGEDLRGKTLGERKKILKEIIPHNNPDLIYSAHIVNKGTDFFAEIQKRGGEGIIAKRLDSKYESGRSKSWLKIKTERRQEAVIAGFTKPRKSRSYFGALVLGVYENKSLKYIGHTGTGFTESTLKDTYQKLKKIVVSKAPFHETPKTNMPVTWVKPELVCETRFTEWTKEGSMRHPVFLGLRKDKTARSVTREIPSSKRKIHENSSASEPKKNETNINRVVISNPNKIFWPKQKYTKADVINYYDKISKIILPYLKDRPQSLLRHPNGITEKGFFQKNFEQKNLPSFMETIKIPSDHSGEINYLLCQNKESLLYIANLGCIELNPWNSKITDLENPDIMIIDLDPVNRPFSDVIKVALKTKEILDLACESSYCKTSGKRGLHIIVPLKPKYGYESIRLFSGLLAQIIHARMPEITSLERSPQKRNKKIYLDWLQNRKGQTLAAPYSLRPTDDATVSTPIEWSELNSSLDPKKFTIQTIWKRLEKKGDIWMNMHKTRTDLADSIKCLKSELEKINEKTKRPKKK